jgi:hypothetical protein
MRFAGFSAITLLLASSSAIPTKRQALIDSIGGSSLDDVMAEIKNNGNISLLGDLIEIAVDALSTEASAVAECFNPAATSALGAGASGSGSGSLGSGSGGLGAGAGVGANTPAASAAAELSSLLGSVASAATSAPDAANNAAQEAAAAASSALNFLSTANPAASVAPSISSLLSSIAGNTAAIPTGAASSLVDAAAGAPSQLSSILGSVASEAGSVPSAAAAASSALGFLSTANPAASVAPAISSLLSSIAANPSATIPANAASSLTNAASSVIANLPGVSAGAGIGAGVGIGGGNGNPAFSSFVSSLANDPAVTGAPALSSAIASLTNPAVSIGSSLASDLSSVLANPSATLPSGAVSSLVSAISSAVNNGGVTVSPVTNTRGSSSSAASSSSTPIVCPFASESKYTALGSQFTRYCNQFYGGDVLNLGNAVLKRQAVGSINGCANICSPNARCLGTSYDPKTGSCTFYSSLTNGVTRNGIMFALRSSAASSILPPASVGATAGASGSVSASVPTGVNAGSTSLRPSLPGFSAVPSGVLSSLASEASTATGVIGSQLSSLISQLTTASAVNTGALSSLISELPTATSLPSGLISSVVGPVGTSRLPSEVSSILSEATSLASSLINAGSTSLRPSLPGFSSVPIISGVTSAVNSLTSEIGASATGVVSSIESDVSSIINSLTSGVTNPTSISSIISSVQSEATASISSILSEGSSAIASITSVVGPITSGIVLPPGVTLPTGVTLTSTTTSCGGALVDLCATLGIGNGVTVNLGLGGKLGSTPTTFSGASGQYTATSTQCNGAVCLALGVGPSVTATLGALNPDGSIIEIGAGLGSTPVVTGVPSIPGVTSTATSCNGVLCLALGVGPSTTVTLGALNSDGSIINVGTGASLSTPAITAPSVPTTLPGGAVITTTTASCNSVLCLALGVGPSTTITLGALNTDGSIVSASAALPVSTPAITSVTVVPTSTVIGGSTITAISQSCTGSGLAKVCINLGLGPLGTISLGADALPTSGGLVSAGVSASLPVASAAVTVPAVLATPLTISGNTITAVSTSCSGAAIDACVTLGLGNIATVTLGAGVLPSDGGLASAGVSATLPIASAAVTVPALLATPLTISGNTITAVSTSCNGALVNACVTLGLGNIATVSLDAGVLPTNGGLATASAAAGVSNVASVSAGVTLAPTAVAVASVITTTRRTTSCSGGLLGVPLVCATVNVPGLATVSVVARDQPTTLATLVRK